MMSRRSIWWFVIGAALALATLGWRYHPVVVTGASMSPALHSGEIALMDRGAVRSTGLHDGDIVVFRHGRETLVKRVYAIGGEAVHVLRFSNGSTALLGDNAFPADRLLKFAREHPEMVHISREMVPPGAVFVLGDNRNCSVDSRDFGPVPVASIVGRVLSHRDTVGLVPRRLNSARVAAAQPTASL